MTVDEEEALLLARARRTFTPARDQEDRVRAAVLATVAVPGAELPESYTSGSNGAGAVSGAKGLGAAKALGTASAKTWLVGAALAIGAASGAGILAFGGSEPEPRASSPATPGNEIAGQMLPAVSPSEPASPPERAAPATSEAPAPAAPPEMHDPLEGHDQPAPGPKLAERPAPSDAPALVLRDELAGVREAEKALNAGQPGRALAALEELERFPGGSLREERGALRVLANCQLATASSGEQARRFLSTYAKSMYASRVRQACGE